MNDLLTFMYIALVIFIAAWFVQLGAHPASARATFAAVIMVIAVMLIIGTVALTLISLIFSVFLVWF